MAIEKTEPQLYAKVKQTVYEILIMESDEFITKLKKTAYPTEELKQICLNTIAHPNDLAIMAEMLTTFDEKKISEKLGIPVDVIRAKGKEYSRYKTWDVFKNNEDIKKLAYQVSNIDAAKCDEILTRLK